MVGKQPAQVIRRQSRPCMSEQISEVVGYVYREQPAALGQGVHEGMFPCRFLTPYVQAIPKRELYGLDPLLGQVVGYLRDTGLQDIGQVVPLIAEVPHRFSEQSDRHKSRIVPHPVGGLYRVEDGLCVLFAVSKPVVSRKAQFPAYSLVFTEASHHGDHLLTRLAA